ncbi:hypothetical protein ASPZODRAFT_64279 [Penicilliopsis zonata CBS 506.65]|uniref:Erythromycin esterase n=1 Tax=Penicilliopsis zonata CBS 506.65 TaxID=1073090 RepID=A0A1L9SKC8_9EURO|nr:hypothetical protein ASPZODRAFT_64279 [Penicilliopsis zonata CBS 506.65]OJJ47617.1 hypothetical protein ASPZODRAFT_64279 [Penicilliopsis zonata CBS 506.65]
MAVRRSARLRGRQTSAEPQPQANPPNTTTPVFTPVKSFLPMKKTPKTAERKDFAVKTPTTAFAVRPPREEMHPSKVHQSTTKQADSGLILGFNPVKRDAKGNVIKESVMQNTPSKLKASPSSQMGTPGFEFKFSCHESQLSDEAKKLMDTVREDAARIKAQMVQDKTKHARQEAEEENLQGDRLIAKPKGKVGRFSDVHMAEFKKMDSIAGHASAYRAAPGRFQPVTKSLKRTNSKARLDEPESSRNNEKSLSTTPSKSPSKLPAPAFESAASVKRVKHSAAEDTSTGRPSSRDGKTATPGANLALPRPRPSMRPSLMTPTKSSMARFSSARPIRTSMIPSLTQSPGSKAIAAPHTPKTEFNPRLKSKVPTLNNLKSILRRHQPLFSKDPAKIAAGTHVADPDFTFDMLVKTSRPDDDAAQTPSPKKRVEFTPIVKSSHLEVAQASPSPSKIPTARTPMDVVYPTLPTLTPEKDAVITKSNTASIRKVRPSARSASGTHTDLASMPKFPAVPHGIINKKRARQETDDTPDAENVPPATAVELTPDGRSAKRMKMSVPSPIKDVPTPSPVKVIRSMTPGRSRLQGTPTRGGTPGSARAKGKNVLTLSRLNMLSKPKNRS